MDDPYSELRQSLAAAGLYMPTTEDMGSWHRLIVCSEGPPAHARFNGRSFWLALVDRSWYVGAWGSHCYRLPDPKDLLPLTREFLSDTGTMGDFSSAIKCKYELIALDDSEVDQILPDRRTVG